jgi:hypothetical protein
MRKYEELPLAAVGIFRCCLDFKLGTASAKSLLITVL